MNILDIQLDICKYKAGGLFDSYSLLSSLLPKGSKRRKIVKKLVFDIKELFTRNKDIRCEVQQEDLDYQPKFSIIMPVYNVEKKYLKQAIDSVLNQTYDNWELCIVDDASTRKYIKPILQHYSNRDKRIKVIFSETNRYIAGASNLALKIATGDFISFLDNDDILCSNALYECAKFINEIGKDEVDLLYSDNYVIDEYGRIINNMIKPKWSPEYYLTTNYIVHFCVYSKRIMQILKQLNESEQFKAVQDIEIKARLMQYTDKIKSIPKSLYKWRTVPGSTSTTIYAKNYMEENSIRVFQSILENYYGYSEAKIIMPESAKRLGIGFFKVEFNFIFKPCIIIIYVNLLLDINIELLSNLQKLAKRLPLKILVVYKYTDIEREGSEYIEYVKNHDILERLSNEEAEYLIILNSELTDISEESFKDLIGYLELTQKIGAVGGKLLSSDKRIQGGAYLFMNELQIQNSGSSSEASLFSLLAHNCSAVTGGLMATRKEFFIRFGGFDVESFGVFADADYCLKLRKEGLRIVYNPNAYAITRNTYVDYLVFSRIKEEYRKLKNKYPEIWGNDPYYSSQYSQDIQYLVR